MCNVERSCKCARLVIAIRVSIWVSSPPFITATQLFSHLWDAVGAVGQGIAEQMLSYSFP